MNPFFSIIIPTYNRAEYLIEAINSILQQSFQNFEIIIIDDGSTDNTHDIVSGFRNNKIKYFFQENAERSTARNNGVEKASGEYIIFLDSDDVVIPDFLLQLYDNICSSEDRNMLYFYKILFGTKTLFDLLPPCTDIIKYIVANRLVISVSQAAIPRNFLQTNRFAPELNMWEDTHLFIRLLALFKYTSVDLTGIEIRKHAGSSVVINLTHINIRTVKKYLFAVNHLTRNYFNLLQNHVTHIDFMLYKEAKLDMFLYQSLISRNFLVSYRIQVLIIRNNPVFKNFVSLVLLPLRQLRYSFSH